MTRTISLITATVGAALLFAVPAWGDNWGADQNGQSVGYLNPDAADRAASAKQQHVDDNARRARAGARRVCPESRPAGRSASAALGTKNEITLSSDFYADGFAQATAAERTATASPFATIGSGSIASTTPSSVTVTSSGTRDRVAADRHRARDRARAGARAVSRDAVHADPPARALIWVVETRWRPRPPQKGRSRCA